MSIISADGIGPSFDIAVVTPPRPAAVDRVKVLHLVNGELYAGAERVQDLLAERLRDDGFDVSFACLKPGRFAVDRHWRDAPLVDVAMRSRFDLSPARRVANL